MASDADYVDYISELMGGFAIPDYLKEYRKNRQYLFVGLRMNPRHGAHGAFRHHLRRRRACWLALIPKPNDKERRFCAKMNIHIIEADVDDLLTAAGSTHPVSEALSATQDIGG